MSRKKGKIIPEKIRKNVNRKKARYQTFFNKSITSTERSPALFPLLRFGKPPTLPDGLTNRG